MPLRTISLSLAILLFLAPTAFPQGGRSASPPGPRGTDVPGGAVSGRWTRLGSPYRVLGDLDVGTLVIEPGVEVRSAPDVEIRVLGSLRARGRPGRPILFSALDPVRRWSSLRLFFASGVSAFEHTRIERAADSGLIVQNSLVSRFASCVLADNRGGGLFVTTAIGDLLLEDCVFEDNVKAGPNSVSGGGLSVNMSGKFAMEDCIVRRNRAVAEPCGWAWGGGLGLVKAASADLIDCVFEDNECVGGTATLSVCFCRAEALGGGISLGCICSPQPMFPAQLTRCIVRGNRAIAMNNGVDCPSVVANAAGGGIYYAAPTQPLSLDNVLVSGNVVWADGDVQTARGAAIFFRGGTLTATNVTVARNTAIDGQSIPTLDSVLSPGVQVVLGVAEIRNSVLWENRTCVTIEPPPVLVSCSGLAFDDPFQGDGLKVATYSDIEGGVIGQGNLDVLPQFAGPGSGLADLSILPSSPCVDAGNPSPVFEDVSFPPSHGGPRNDMGHNGGPLAGGWPGSNP